MKRANSYRYNVLLVKDDVGKSKPNTRRLPDQEFSYGKPEIRDIEDAGQGKYHSYAQLDTNTIENMLTPFFLTSGITMELFTTQRDRNLGQRLQTAQQICHPPVSHHLTCKLHLHFHHPY